MPLHLHRASRTDLLADELAGLLATPMDDPFAEEVVAVPARGVERWLTQRLSHRLGTSGAGSDGVCAGVRFLSPSSLVTLLLDRERDDPWSPDRLVWPLLAAIDESLDEPWAETLARHLGHGDDSPEADLRAGRRFSVAHRLAWLFHSYASQRPRLLADWRAGRATDGLDGALDHDLAWQPELWRRVVDRVGEPPPDERHRDTLQRLERGDPTLDLPDRLSLFGHTRLTRTDAELLSALAAHRDVHLWLPQASPGLWDALDDMAAIGPVPRRDDDSGERVNHRLLASLGRDSRELPRTLGGLDVTAGPAAPDPSAAQTWLGWLQADVRVDHEPTDADRAVRVVAPQDRSFQVHACHGPARQVDVLREVLTGLLQDDPTLEPRDVLVMCPDIETYAPLVQAAFGLADLNLAEPGHAPEHGHPAHQLRVALADRALTSTNPLLDLAARLVSLAGGRFTVSEVLDIAGSQPVRRRFDLDDDDLEVLTRWVEQAAIRWGLDAPHRASYHLGNVHANTWAFGLDRLLLGVAMAEGIGHHVDAVLPVDDVDSGAIDLAGRLAELVDRLAATFERIEQASTPAAWVAALADGVRSLTDVPLADAWQTAQLDRELGAVVSTADDATALRLSDVRVMLDRQLGGRPTRSSFRTGTLTICTMTPMRSVPHRVVCLLGLDDGVFPRHADVDGDDVLARTPVTGERDRRSEDRQLLLDAVMAASEHLVVTYSGADEHTGGVRPPAVPLGELLDAAAHAVTLPTDRSVVVRHPLQPFDERNLVGGRLGTPEPFSFDGASLAGAQAAAGERHDVPPLISGALPDRAPEDVSLEDLLRFFDHPAKAFLRDRLDVALIREADEPDDAITVEIEPGLGEWQVGDRMLRDALAGLPPEEVFANERRRGLLPPDGLGDLALTKLGPIVGQLVRATDAVRQGESRAVDIDVDLRGGRRLAGTIPSVYGTAHVATTYSASGAKPLLRAWITALVLAAGAPSTDGGWQAHAVCRRGRGAQTSTFGPIEPEQAAAWLRELVDVRDRGLREPVPFGLKTSHAWAESRLRRPQASEQAALPRARERWEGGAFPGENADPAHVLIYGERSRLDVLLTPPIDDEAWGSSLVSNPTTRLGQYALRVFGPMLAHGGR